MKIEIKSEGVWYHGSNVLFSELRTNSTITQWKELQRRFHTGQSGILFRKGSSVFEVNRATLVLI